MDLTILEVFSNLNDSIKSSGKGQTRISGSDIRALTLLLPQYPTANSRNILLTVFHMGFYAAHCLMTTNVGYFKKKKKQKNFQI